MAGMCSPHPGNMDLLALRQVTLSIPLFPLPVWKHFSFCSPWGAPRWDHSPRLGAVGAGQVLSHDISMAMKFQSLLMYLFLGFPHHAQVSFLSWDWQECCAFRVEAVENSGLTRQHTPFSPAGFQPLSALILLPCLFSSGSKCFFRPTGFELFIGSVFSLEINRRGCNLDVMFPKSHSGKISF